MSLAIALAGAAAAALLYRALSVAVRRLDASAPRGGPLPPVTVIRPVRGVDPGLAENARRALRSRYPGELETLFVLDDASDPALPVLRRAIELERADARIVFSGAPPEGRTGKLHAMIRGLAAARARTPLVCFADSDTRPEPGLVGELAAVVVAAPDVGASFARVIGGCAPRSAGDVGYALLLDGIYGPQAALAARARRGLPFVMGQTMVVRRSALDACGGLESSDGELVDDMNIGARLARAGYRNVLSGSPVAIVQERLGFCELQDIAVRWMVFARTGIPFWPFAMPAALWTGLYLGGLVGALISVGRGEPLPALAFAATSVSVVIALERLRRLQGGPPLPVGLWWAPFLCLALVPWWFARARFAKRIVWRGRPYELGSDGRLGAPVPG